MNSVEDDLRAVLRHRAATIDISMGPSTDLVRRGEGVRRRRRRVQLAAATFVAGAVIAPWALLGHGFGHHPATPTRTPTPSATPTPTPSTILNSLPQGAPPTLPYLVGHALHVNGFVISTAGDRIYAAGAAVLVQKWSGTDPTWWRLAGQRLIKEPELQGVFQVDLSPNGSLATWWINPDSRTSRIVAWDPRTHHEIAHTDLPLPATCCDGGSIQNLQVDNHGAIRWSDAKGSRVWHPGTPPQMTPHAPDGSLAVVSADGSLEASGSTVHDFRTGTDHYLAIPAGVGTSPIGFESDQEVLVSAYPTPVQMYVLRCSVTTSACVRALTPDGRSTWTFSGNF